MRESVTKGKKIWKESGFSSSRFGGFFEGGWYIYVREEKERGFLGLLWVRRTGTDVHEFLKDLGEESYREEKNWVKAAGYASCYFFYSRLHSILHDPLTIFLNIQSLLIGVDGRATISSIEIGCFFVYLRLLFLSMSLISYENNMHLGQSLILMMEILPCSRWKSVLNHSPILSQWIKIMKCGLSAYPPLSPLLCFSWIIFFLFFFCIHISSLSPLVSWATETMMIWIFQERQKLLKSCV